MTYSSPNPGAPPFDGARLFQSLSSVGGAFINGFQSGMPNNQSQNSQPTNGNAPDLQAVLQGVGQVAQAFNASSTGSRGSVNPDNINQAQEGAHVVGQAAAQTASQMFSNLGQQFNNFDQQGSAAPPTSASAVRSLPKVKVSAYDLQQNEQTSCAVCLEEFALGEEATRVPCGHLFHEACIKAWLEKHNQCPVCRYEMPTDDARHESGRRARMAERRPRMSLRDLRMRSAQDLRRLAEHLQVSVEGCLEKSDLVDRIVASGYVEIVPDAAPQGPDLEATTGSMLSREQIQKMSVREIKAEMQRLGVNSEGCIEKDDLIDRFLVKAPASA